MGQRAWGVGVDEAPVRRHAVQGVGEALEAPPPPELEPEEPDPLEPSELLDPLEPSELLLPLEPSELLDPLAPSELLDPLELLPLELLPLVDCARAGLPVTAKAPTLDSATTKADATIRGHAAIHMEKRTDI